MNPVLRILGIMLVFGVASVAWWVFGAVMMERTHDQDGKLRGEVVELWGKPQVQQAPELEFSWISEEDRERVEEVDGERKTIRTREKVQHAKNVKPTSSDLSVDLQLDQRLKGLLWYSLYDVDFAGAWRYLHRESQTGTLRIAFRFPDAEGLYDDFRFVVNGKDRAATMRLAEGRWLTDIAVEPGSEVVLESGYRSRGMDEWRYAPAAEVASLEHFELQMSTDFEDIDFPAGTMSPSSRANTSSGWQLNWEFNRVVTGQQIGMVMSSKIQPGELASRLAFSAPISLLFFFLLMFVLATLRGIEIHPVNYLFLAGAFFAFHLLFGYSVDHLPVAAAFIIASAVSIILVVSYLRLVVSPRFAFVEAAAAQLVYLVGFSLAHFWEGFTGLTVTVLSIATLFILMQLTGRLKWAEVLAPRPRQDP